MKHNEYSTTIYIQNGGDEILLLNDTATVIARTDVITKELIWSHSCIDATVAKRLTREHHERYIKGTASYLAAHYDSFVYRSVFHAITAAIRNGSTLHARLRNPYKVVKTMDGFLEHMKTCALNPGQFSVGSCSYCGSGCYVEDVALVSIGVPIVSDEQANIHGKNGVAINPICHRCSEGVQVEN